jgi:LPXTG-site transpeptidase (sortase) family protein
VKRVIKTVKNSVNQKKKRIGIILTFFGIIIIILAFTFENVVTIYPLSKIPIFRGMVLEKNQEITSNQIHIGSQLLPAKTASQFPERIIIPSQKINLKVVEAPVINGYWEISKTNASHGVGSVNPGEIGNTVIFAHAKEGLFLSLKDIKVNDEIIILTKDKWYRYNIKVVKDVSLDQAEVIAPTKDEILTLYTCSGFLDSKRRVVQAKRM